MLSGDKRVSSWICFSMELGRLQRWDPVNMMYAKARSSSLSSSPSAILLSLLLLLFLTFCNESPFFSLQRAIAFNALNDEKSLHVRRDDLFLVHVLVHAPVLVLSLMVSGLILVLDLCLVHALCSDRHNTYTSTRQPIILLYRCTLLIRFLKFFFWFLLRYIYIYSLIRYTSFSKHILFDHYDLYNIFSLFVSFSC